MNNIIRINKAVFYAYHGVLKEEQRFGGKFEADIEMHIDFSAAAKTDSLSNTIDYEKVYSMISEISTSKKFYLIETVAYMIIEKLYETYKDLTLAVIKVRKNNPPIGGVVDSVEVEIELTKSEYLSLKSSGKYEQIFDKEG
ncbi:MAG: dihydroneopterin aldolase [Ignavibacteriaceae bacterium]|nr:dihydroneopterin aldolase [Ignavibacteriaceae bacterium]